MVCYSLFETISNQEEHHERHVSSVSCHKTGQLAISLLAIWEQQYKQPLYLITNMADLDAAVKLYKLRAYIETFFSDLKSRGFHIHKSHLSDPARLSRLLIACCLAYLWLVYLGVCAMRDDWMSVLHR